ncbi:MAG TPA: carbonic anhydrase [Pyrinomonadaceae bacterium]|jgi:carbonic anhydrase|nr:carbonic anhydrase [Chloracidobacterium sp.]MBK9439125.1 carbonic anhydrase [Chloracidobacterium sp.]HRA39269.1 carbonic anhydrase [Pyrinomonadaceae bacterium]
MFHVQKDRGIPQIGHPVNSKHFEGRPIDHLMIGCSDCSTTEPDILGIKMNRIMSHKNLGNLVHLSDLSSISVVETAVNFLKVEKITVCGHYDCVAIAAALNDRPVGAAGNWLRIIDRVAEKYRLHLDGIRDTSRRFTRLCELNVIEQVHRLCSSPCVIGAWERGQSLTVRGWIFDAEAGAAKDLGFKISSVTDIEDRFDGALARLDRKPGRS